jgi:hypothetical protein
LRLRRGMTEGVCETSPGEAQGVFDEPNRPKKPFRHSPQVSSIVEHVIRFNAKQTEAFEQLTRFKIVVVKERVFFRSSGLLFSWEELIPSNMNRRKSSISSSFSSTRTVEFAVEGESNWSNTITTQVRLELDSSARRWVPEGRSEDVCDSCNLDRNRIKLEEVDCKYPNWKDKGRSSSTQPNPIIENEVCSITPLAGLTSKAPPKGGEFVLMVTRFDEEWPFERTQLRVNVKEDCRGRVLPTITKLNTWGELGPEEGRDCVRGDSDPDDNTIESSFTDHRTSPRDAMSTLPKSFSFEEGFIFNPDRTSNFTTGAREARMESWIDFSQLLTTPEDFEEEPW